MGNQRKQRDTALFGVGLAGRPLAPPGRGALHKRFGWAPFSVLNTRDKMWQQRRRQWLKLGIKSELGRSDIATFNITADYSTGKGMPKESVFDPVLTELAYQWYAPPGGIILDPFAGGSVRGVVASVMGYKYWGSELRAEQVKANRAQLNDRTRGTFKPKWVIGDSAVNVPKAPKADMVIGCPPYGNLEVYSDDPDDISNMSYADFLTMYRRIIMQSVDRLRDDRFIVWVVGSYRDKRAKGLGKHATLPFVGDTVTAFLDQECILYNEAVLLNSVGTGAMRANTTFLRGHRKLVRTHQSVLVFCKGDPVAASKHITNCETE